MDLAARQDVRDGVDRGQCSQLAVILHAQIPVFRTRVQPRDHEYRVAPIDEVLDQRIVRRQVQDVVLHHPCGLHQNRFALDSVRAWRVLDQFHQQVTIDDLAGCDGEVFSDLEGVDSGRLLVAQGAADVLAIVLGAARQIGAAFVAGRFHDLGVHEWHIAGGSHVQDLLGGKPDCCLAVLRNAANAGGGVMPPLLVEQEALVDHVVRKALPARMVKAMVAGERLDAVFGIAGDRRGKRVRAEAHSLAGGLGGELELFAGRGRQMHGPIQIGHSQGSRRDTAT